MKIGIIGSGMIGSTFGKLFGKADHEVMFSSRSPEKLKKMAAELGAKTGSVEETCEWAELLLLAVPFKAIPNLGSEHTQSLEGKIIIDACNPYPGRDGELAQRVVENPALSSSLFTQQHFPKSIIIKAFNATYFKEFETRAFKEGEERLAVPVAGDNEESKKHVMDLIEEIGLAPIDFGSLKESKKFEPGTPPYNVNITFAQAKKDWAGYVG